MEAARERGDGGSGILTWPTRVPSRADERDRGVRRETHNEPGTYRITRLQADLKETW